MAIFGRPTRGRRRGFGQQSKTLAYRAPCTWVANHFGRSSHMRLFLGGPKNGLLGRGWTQLRCREFGTAKHQRLQGAAALRAPGRPNGPAGCIFVFGAFFARVWQRGPRGPDKISNIFYRPKIFGRDFKKHHQSTRAMESFQWIASKHARRAKTAKEP